ncbi:3-dehydroquinate dehydratase [Desulfocicer vacuolatum DSM 3385]|uniref:3-dehydroquinate dehydratase n=1 Tax=Desulfocicer vacuolatum DSM 3385 TaxID=1121400 RepID=A0A1W2DQW2_9BACT|nr:type I 3-dehydroquinate dehydratase [Desulfocicer vacuolatum]SMC99426.1 3-dehydroquinate dehydratase [Desulfocicer vacuolatum DSM 3385]
MRMDCRHPVHVKGKIIGGPDTLICLPLVATDRTDLLLQAQKLMPLEPDLLEWRVDALNTVEDGKEVMTTLSHLRNVMEEVPLIFTCRIDVEGGMGLISRHRDARLDIICRAMETGLVDIVDIELCNDETFIKTIRHGADKNGVKLILSSHDFEKTPDESVILNRLGRAQDLGADIAKLAAMPTGYQDVLLLLSATLKARTDFLKIPMITISMEKMGLISRLAGGLFGSDVTFAMGDSASAPGQIPIQDLRRAMGVLSPKGEDA